MIPIIVSAVTTSSLICLVIVILFVISLEGKKNRRTFAGKDVCKSQAKCPTALLMSVCLLFQAQSYTYGLVFAKFKMLKIIFLFS